jgi:Secretion system C-terminal sorting domain/Immunoglobulin domain
MKRSFLFLKSIFVVLFVVFLINAQAQCPASVTATISSQTVATCPSNASVTIGSNANGVGTATYQALVAPSGVGLSPQSSNVFTSLPPGNYTFKVVCGALSATVNTIITTTYTQLTANTNITNVCSAYIAGGTITVSAAGGTLPYSYSLLKTTNANYSDALSTYGASNILNPTDSGTYQVRIKDNCGNFITKTVFIQPTVPAIYLNPTYLDNDQPCGSGNIRLYYYLTDINGSGLSSADMPYGYRMDIYQKGTGCTRGAFIKTVNKAQNSSDRTTIPINQNIYIKVTNSCGDTTAVCYTYPVADATYKIFWQPVQTGCASAANPNGLLNLGKDWSQYGKGPELYSVIKLNGTVVRTPTADSAIFHNLPYDTYVIVGQDACGLIAKDTLIPPAPGATVYFDDWQSLDCTNQTGTLSFHSFVLGFVYDLEHAVITITSGPSNVGVQPIYNRQLGFIQWLNMLPGNYIASIVTSCGTTMVNFSINPYISVLQQSLNVVTEQACNNGGIIRASLNYNGDGTTSFGLFDAANVNIGNNSSGVFTGIAAGNYTVKAKIQLWGQCLGSYTIDKPIVILPDGAPPQVVKKIVMICEDAVGNPIGNGKAIIRSLGFAPFKVEAKKVIDPDANYNLKFAASVNDFTVDNLLPYDNYRIRITDQCGNTALTDVSVGIMEQLTPINNGTPCISKPYTLSAPDMIDATYTWRKGSTIVATSREIIFPSYAAANDGTYTCTLSIGGGCVTRTVNNTLNGISCSVLPIIIENFSANFSNCKTQLNWKTNNTNTSAAKVDVERSTNGINFDVVKSMSTNVLDNSVQTFVDINPAKAINFYRLVITDNDGKKVQSKVIMVKNNCDEDKNSLTIYPNPVAKGNNVNINIISSVAGNAELRLLNNMGQLVSTKTIITKAGNTSITIPSTDMNSGVYIVSVKLANGETLIQKLIKD